MKTLQPSPLQSRARVRPVSTVSAYLHGQAGTVVEHRNSPISGPVAVLEFDTPVARHHSPTMPLKHCAFSANQLQPLSS